MTLPIARIDEGGRMTRCQESISVRFGVTAAALFAALALAGCGGGGGGSTSETTDETVTDGGDSGGDTAVVGGEVSTLYYSDSTTLYSVSADGLENGGSKVADLAEVGRGMAHTVFVTGNVLPGGDGSLFAIDNLHPSQVVYVGADGGLYRIGTEASPSPKRISNASVSELCEIDVVPDYTDSLKGVFIYRPSGGDGCSDEDPTQYVRLDMDSSASPVSLPGDLVTSVFSPSSGELEGLIVRDGEAGLAYHDLGTGGVTTFSERADSVEEVGMTASGEMLLLDGEAYLFDANAHTLEPVGVSIPWDSYVTVDGVASTEDYGVVKYVDTDTGKAKVIRIDPDNGRRMVLDTHKDAVVSHDTQLGIEIVDDHVVYDFKDSSSIVTLNSAAIDGSGTYELASGMATAIQMPVIQGAEWIRYSKNGDVHTVSPEGRDRSTWTNAYWVGSQLAPNTVTNGSVLPAETGLMVVGASSQTDMGGASLKTANLSGSSVSTEDIGEIDSEIDTVSFSYSGRPALGLYVRQNADGGVSVNILGASKATGIVRVTDDPGAPAQTPLIMF
jgi:hypothetical protein